MGRWLVKAFFFACAMIALRLVAGHFYPELGGKKVKEAVARVLPIHHFVPHREQVPLAIDDYQRIGFPEARSSGAWVRQDLAGFHKTLEALPHDYRGSFPGADGDYGKSVFSKIIRLEEAYSSLPLEEQGEVLDLIGRIHNTYLHAHNYERIRYDREILLLRGVYTAMLSRFLGKIEKQFRHLQSDIASATGMLGYGTDEVKLERRLMSEAILQYTSNSMSPGLFETRKVIEKFVEETTNLSSFRPQAQKLALRYYERHLASIGKHIGGDYRTSIEKGYRRSVDPEVKELYRRILLTFDQPLAAEK